MTFGTWRW